MDDEHLAFLEQAFFLQYHLHMPYDAILRLTVAECKQLIAEFVRHRA